MGLLDFLTLAKPRADGQPSMIREIRDIGGVRVIRLQGPVGKEVAAEADQAEKQAEQIAGAFTRPLLFDFAGTSGWDFSTVAYLVRALRRRMASGACIGATRGLSAGFERAGLIGVGLTAGAAVPTCRCRGSRRSASACARSCRRTTCDRASRARALR